MKEHRVFYAKVEESQPVAGGHQKPVQEPQSLFAARKKIFMRAVKGRFNTWRWIFVWLTQILFYVTPWLIWNGRQAILIDLNSRHYYFLGLVFSSSDIVYMAAILIISALGLFLFTAIAGRLWCGYTCPQTVYTEIFMWIERKIEGDRVAQMRLDKAPLSAQKVLKKGTKHLLWVLFALWSGFTLTGYFTPIRELVADTLNLNLSGAEIFWIVFYGFMMYLFAGWMREQVCKYMCPYARFQSVMFDPDTLIVTYDAERGEPRGARKKNIDPKTVGKGDCIDCGVCVDVCPTGIDIRKGLQMECIGCAACIDACDSIMDKMKYPKGLIRYDTETGVSQHLTRQQVWRRALRGRVLVYGLILLVLVSALLYSLGERDTLKISVERDARTMARVLDSGEVENIYRVQLINTDEKPQKVVISVHGLNGLSVAGGGERVLEPLSNATEVIKLHADPAKARSSGATSGNNPIVLHVKSTELDEDVSVDTVFALPKQ